MKGRIGVRTVTVRDDSLQRSLGKLAETFGDPTRRAILQHVLDAPTPLSASEVAEAFGLHRTVARAHLEKLVVTGLLETGTRRAAVGGGRPAKVYAPSGERLEVILPPRRYESLAVILLDVVERLAPVWMAVHHAEAAGYAYGVRLRSELGGDESEGLDVERVCAWLAGEGYVPRCERQGDRDVFTLENCVYREIALEHPEIACAVTSGLLCGLLDVPPEQHTQTCTLAEHGFCRHEIRR